MTDTMMQEQREQRVDALMSALGETKGRKSEPWWHLYYIAARLPPECVDVLVAEARAIYAGEGMQTTDGSRKRTLGGVFFALAKVKLIQSGWRRIHWRASWSWARWWLRKLGADGPVPTTAEGLQAALALRGEAPSKNALLALVTLASTPPKLKGSPHPHTPAGAGAAAQHVKAMPPERFQPARSGRGVPLRMPPVEVLPPRRKAAP